MKPEDLMVGDWVLLFDKTPVKVDCIGNVEVYLTEQRSQHELDWRVTYEHIKQIPLTPEILEKNGFDINGIPEDMQPVEERDWSDDTYVWSTQETPDEVMEVSVYMDDPYNFFAEIICQYCHVEGVHIKYVHELQHVLRLCGIYKEIVL